MTSRQYRSIYLFNKCNENLLKSSYKKYFQVNSVNNGWASLKNLHKNKKDDINEYSRFTYLSAFYVSPLVITFLTYQDEFFHCSNLGAENRYFISVVYPSSIASFIND